MGHLNLRGGTPGKILSWIYPYKVSFAGWELHAVSAVALFRLLSLMREHNLPRISSSVSLGKRVTLH